MKVCPERSYLQVHHNRKCNLCTSTSPLNDYVFYVCVVFIVVCFSLFNAKKTTITLVLKNEKTR